MESMESPLDVLSRAATMVQDSLPSTNTVSEESNKQTSTKQLPTTKWKRERRRLPEYSRKSDPKLSEIAGELQAQTPTPTSPNRAESSPIDMSVRQRGQPPSYSQAISSPGYRPSVITQAPHPAAPHLPSGISMCDPIIDEHFRRSLGKDYLMLFNNNKTSIIDPPAPPSPSPTPVTIPKREMSDSHSDPNFLLDSAGLSVDDHFAKALGDTWFKLNQKEPETGADKPAVVSL